MVEALISSARNPEVTTILSVPAAYYAARVADFIGETTESILGTLTAKSSFAVEPLQRDAWIGEVEILKEALLGTDGSVFLEFDVPRIGSRIDAVLVVGPAVFVIEFKVGERHVNTQRLQSSVGLRARLEELSLSQPQRAHSASPCRHGV